MSPLCAKVVVTSSKERIPAAAWQLSEIICSFKSRRAAGSMMTLKTIRVKLREIDKEVPCIVDLRAQPWHVSARLRMAGDSSNEAIS